MAKMLENENMGWNSTPPPTLRSFPSPTNSRQFAKKDTSCFGCKQEGHWVNDCPMKSPDKKTPTSPPADDFPVVRCLCDGPCAVRVSKTSLNPGRKFYTCSRFSGCRFFMWCEEVTSDINIKIPPCGCKAGPCHIYKETSGQDASRLFFVCPIKKGQGACSFVQPMDSINKFVDEQLLDSTNDVLDDRLLDTLDLLEDQLVDVPNFCLDESLSPPPSSGNTSPSSRDDIVEEGNSSHQEMEIESPVVDTPKNGEFFSTARPLVNFKGLEDTSEEPLRKHRKRPRHGDQEIHRFFLDSVSDSLDLPQSKSMGSTTEKALRPHILTSGSLIRQRQVKFPRQISSAGASLPEASSYCNASALTTTGREFLRDCCVNFNFEGWCGRLVFSPSRSLTFPAPKPFFCGVFPCFDAIYFPQDADTPSIESRKMALIPFQPSGAPLCGPPGLKPPLTKFPGKIMKESVVQKFKRAAASLQGELFTLLESMDIKDHVSMLEEANFVFGALERLVVDYEPFKKLVIEYIGSAASLAQVELSIDSDDRSSHELFDSFNRKKLQLEDVSRCHVETSAALEASNKHLQNLEKEASHLKDMLLRVEEELACCKVKNMEIHARFNQVAEDKLQLEFNLQSAFNEAEEAKKACQQREAERNIAKASIEKARLELQQTCNMLCLM